MHPLATSHQPRATTRRSGFTLTELLVVIAIIAMLVAITSVGVMRAITTAKQTRIKTEVDALDLAMKAYKEKYGSYPPCDLRQNNDAAIRQHLARAFPRYADLANFRLDFDAAGIDKVNFRPDQALVFWLRGFSNDPAHPFVSLDNKQLNGTGPPGTTTLKLQPLFDFDQTRLIAQQTGTANMPSYFPPGLKVQSNDPTDPAFPFPIWSSGGAPYVYWDASFYQVKKPPTNVDGTPDPASMRDARSNIFNDSGIPFGSNAGVAAPYWLDANGNASTYKPEDINSNESWANPESFQIIACGTDGKYGNSSIMLTGAWARMYPTGKNYDATVDEADDDNCTNFAAKARIGDARP